MDFGFEDYDIPDYLTEDLIPEGMDLSDLDLSDIPEELLEQLMAEYLQDDYGMNDYGMNDYGMYDYESEPQQMMGISYTEHFKECGFSTLQQGIQIICPLLLFSICIKLSAATGLSKVIVHLLSLGTGLASLYLFFHTSIHFLVTFSVLGYSLLFLLDQTQYPRKGAACAVMCLLYLLTLELFIAEPTEWHKVRGSQMILAMKIISIGFDLDTGQIPSLPGLLEYHGYSFCVGSVIFGPWTSFDSYLDIVQSPSLNWRWLFSGVYTFLLSLVFLLCSTCVSSVLFMTSQYKWLHAYKDAFSFRTSHYFVSYASEATATFVGFGETKNEGTISWHFPVARPWKVELPRSLGEVVVNWNLPMHQWLKIYVFKSSRPLGQFTAVLLTFMASAMLHGLNFQLASVLISLAFLSYVEFGLRKKLADAFSCCILARSCKPECGHSYQKFNPVVLLINLAFGLLSVFHLAYLGVMFDTESELQEEGYDMAHTLSKWSELDYASHYVALGTFLFYWLI